MTAEHIHQKTGIQDGQSLHAGLEQTTKKGAAAVPRLAMINDIAGFGRCSTAVSLPIISVMGIQVCPVPTSVLSNHFGFPVWHFDDYTPHMAEYLGAWKALQIHFDGLYCGFLGSPEQFGIVEHFLQDFQPSLFLLDPVMGDHGKAYRTITKEHCLRMKNLIQYAHILTPNITEACLLTDTPYQDGPWQEEELILLCRKLSEKCSGKIVITGLKSSGYFQNFIWENGIYTTYIILLCRKLSEKCSGKIVITGLKSSGYFQNFIWENGIYTTYNTKAAGSNRPGTGDIFASVIAACALQNIAFPAAVKKAADFVALCIHGSEEAGTPVRPGTGDIFASVIAACALQNIAFPAAVKKAADFVALCIHGSEEAGTPVQEGVLFEKYLRCLF